MNIRVSSYKLEAHKVCADEARNEVVSDMILRDHGVFYGIFFLHFFSF